MCSFYVSLFFLVGVMRVSVLDTVHWEYSVFHVRDACMGFVSLAYE